MIRNLALVAALAIPAAAQARDYCPARPGLGDTACTMDPGRVSVELGIADWEISRDPAERVTTLAFGDLGFRLGLSDSAEVSLGWTAYTRTRTRTRTPPALARQHGAGDVTLGFKRNLARPDGGGFSLAVAPFASLPVGSPGVGAGDWGAGLVIPISYALGESVAVQWTQTFEAAVDGDGDGRHFASTSVLGLDFSLTDSFGAGVELAASRDEDPAGAENRKLASAYVAWMPSSEWQLDLGGATGLNAASPDLRIYAGVSKRF